MTTELTLLAWTLVLALVQIMLPAMSRTRDFGPAWNAGPRDRDPGKVSPVTGRLLRAQANLFETLPLFAAAVLIAHVAGKEGPLTHWGAMLYFWGRVIYLPLYAAGVPYIRSLVWVASVAGLVMVIAAILLPH
jgi:uncharacterized MAPEG superfamily protein